MTMTNSASGLFNGLLGVLIFSGSLPATRIAVEVFEPMALTAARAVIAALAAGAYLWLARRPLPAREHWPALAIASLMLVYAFPWLMAIATVTLGAAHGAVVMGLLPLATAVAAVLFAGERPSLGFWLASGAGALLVVIFTLRSTGGWTIGPADAVLLLAVAAAAIGYAVSGKLARTMSGLDVIAWAVVLAAPVSLALTLWYAPGLIAAPAGPRHWMALLYVGLFSMFLGFWFWNRGLAEGGVAKVGQIQLLQTFFTLAIAALLLGETITMEMLVFALATAACVVVARRMRVS